MANHRSGVLPDMRECTSANSNARPALHELGDESLVGVVDLMTGEKDPRNLMIVFSILRVIMVEWDISNHAEVGCLYPMRLLLGMATLKP